MMPFTELLANLTQHDYAIIDNFLPLPLLHNLAQRARELHAEKAFVPAKVGHQSTTQLALDLRTDCTYWLEADAEEPAITEFLTIMTNLRQTFNQAFFLSLTEFESHFAFYAPGSFYRKHIDQFSGTRARKISCVFYLNPAWDDNDGGELQLYNRENCLITSIVPRGNRFVCFNSELPHEVREARQARWSIAGWMRVRSG